MDSKLKFTKAIESISFSYELDIEMTNNYDEIQDDILNVLSMLEPQKDEIQFKNFSYVVKLRGGDRFFVSAIIYETPEDVLVVDIREIGINEFLDFIINNKHIKYGI
jgi:hypothetical protein